MNAMYSVEQVNVPSEMGTIMKQYTKAVLRDKPQDVYKYSANFFAMLSGRAAPFDADGQLVEDIRGQPTTTSHHHHSNNNNNNIHQQNSYNDNINNNNNEALSSQQVMEAEEEVAADNNQAEAISEQEAIGAIFNRYDSSGDGFIRVEELQYLLNDIKDALGLSDDEIPPAEEVIDLLNVEEDAVDLLEIRQLLFDDEQ